MSFIQCVHFFCYLKCPLSVVPDEVSLMRPVAEAMNMPIQPPVAVQVHSNISREDTPTGRVIQYHLPDCVAFEARAFGEIELLFQYRATLFAVVKKFNNILEIEPGLVSVRGSLVTKLVIPLEGISRPLIVGKSNQEFIIR